MLVRDADFISAFSAVGRAASGEQDWGDSLSEAYVAVFGGESKAQEVSGNLIGMTVSEQDSPTSRARGSCPHSPWASSAF